MVSNSEEGANEGTPAISLQNTPNIAAVSVVKRTTALQKILASILDRSDRETLMLQRWNE
jgi:hypothetical protein